MRFLENNRAVIFLAMLIRLFGVLTTGDPDATFHRLKDGKLQEQLQQVFLVNNDEMLIAEVAINHRHGLSYMSSLENHRAGYKYDFTAYRPSYPVYLHLFLQSAYTKMFPDRPIRWVKSDPYFVGFGVCIQVISFFLFFCSLFYFRKLSSIFLPPSMVNVSIVLYAIHPAVCFYVGNMVNYESIVTSLLVMHVYLLVKSVRYSLDKKESIILVSSFLIGVLLRPQLVLIYLLMYGVWLAVTFFNRKNFKPGFIQCRKFVLACWILFFIFNIPVLVKNHRLFHAWTLSTTGFNFSLGHNPFARGGWCGNCNTDPGSPYYRYIREKINGYDQLNEYEKSDQLQQLAKQWIMEHPMEELVLVARKVGIYFLPHNNDHEQVNPLNLIFHLGTFAFLILLAYETLAKRKFNGHYWLLTSPLAGSLLVSVLFHVGYRWRYFAEPFMAIMLLIVVEQGLMWYRKRKAVRN